MQPCSTGTFGWPRPDPPRRLMLLQACLNGSRTSEEHPAIPRTPAELAAGGRAAVAAGAHVLHLHPYNDSRTETFAAGPCAATLRAVRMACPGVPISLSTSEAIEPHPQRLETIARWTELPELVTANQGEDREPGRGGHPRAVRIAARARGRDRGWTTPPE
ncbi:MAG: 3-keto-5-aminohexanoate cleavage protein [Actinomycetota bacterium]